MQSVAVGSKGARGLTGSPVNDRVSHQRREPPLVAQKSGVPRAGKQQDHGLFLSAFFQILFGGEPFTVTPQLPSGRFPPQPFSPNQPGLTVCSRFCRTTEKAPAPTSRGHTWSPSGAAVVVGARNEAPLSAHGIHPCCGPASHPSRVTRLSRKSQVTGKMPCVKAPRSACPPKPGPLPPPVEGSCLASPVVLAACPKRAGLLHSLAPCPAKGKDRGRPRGRSLGERVVRKCCFPAPQGLICHPKGASGPLDGGWGRERLPVEKVRSSCL